jgi:hypothetical protein
MVRTEGRDATLMFQCRIGNTLDIPELLAAKEERIEEYLWNVHVTLEELIALLQDLAVRGPDHGETAAAVRAYRERAARAQTNAATLGELIRACRPVNLAPAEPGTEGAGGDTMAEGFEPAGGAAGQ